MELRPPLSSIMEPSVLLRWCAAALILAIVALADGYALVLISRRIGVFGVLALTGATGLLPLVLVPTVYRSEMREARAEIAGGQYPVGRFRRMVTLLSAFGLLLMPGCVSDALGLLLIVRPLGWPIGAVAERAFRSRFVQLYEHERATSATRA